MRGGRKNLKKEALQGCPEPQEGQLIMQVVSLRGSNLIEVMDSMDSKTLAMLPAKFHKSLWIKRGSYVLVEGSNREKASEAGSKVTCMIVHVLFDEQVRTLQKSCYWPEGFNVDKCQRCSETSKERSDVNGVTNMDKLDLPIQKEQENHESEESSSDDGLPPLEANCNRRTPQQLDLTSSEEETSDSDL
uniref:S1-like domain-containing protein n=1 Tax=Araucaria cunninghamii TaxID=56994 RepID=A0A0D6QTM6_ARACU